MHWTKHFFQAVVNETHSLQRVNFLNSLASDKTIFQAVCNQTLSTSRADAFVFSERKSLVIIEKMSQL